MEQKQFEQLLEAIDEINAKLDSCNRPMMNMREAAAYLDMSLSTLYRLTSMQAIPHYKVNGKLVYFDKAEILEWMKHDRVETMSERVARVGG